MSEDKKSGNVTPEDLADPSKHQQFQVFETENRPPPYRPGTSGESENDTETGNAGEGVVGHVAAKDPSGAVAPPAEGSMPGGSTELGGTPGALTTSGGRQVDGNGI